MIELKKNVKRKKIDNQQKGKGRSSMLALRCSELACVAKGSDHSTLKILSPKQILQRLPIAVAQVKAGDTLLNLLNEIKTN